MFYYSHFQRSWPRTNKINYKNIHLTKIKKRTWSQIQQFQLRNCLKMSCKKSIFLGFKCLPRNFVSPICGIFLHFAYLLINSLYPDIPNQIFKMQPRPNSLSQYAEILIKGHLFKGSLNKKLIKLYYCFKIMAMLGGLLPAGLPRVVFKMLTIKIKSGCFLFL